MIIKIKFLFTILLFLSQNTSVISNEMSECSRRKKIASNAIKNTTHKIRKNFDLQCVGVGIGGDYENFSLDFYCYKPITKDEARHMVLSCAEIFGVCMNDVGKSINASNFSFVKFPGAITIYSMDNDYQHYPCPLICVVSFHEKGIEYLTKDEGQKFGYKETIEETLEEAESRNQEYLQKIKENKWSST